MNIFRLHPNPRKSARMMCDKHIVKMPLESAQMLCSVWHRYGHGDKVKYKEAFKKHPCTLWAGDSHINYIWLWSHGMSLCHEYTQRYDKNHACEEIIKGILKVPFTFQQVTATPQPQCMPEEYKVSGDAVKAYRNYYIGDKIRIAKWNKTAPMPKWFRLGIV